MIEAIRDTPIALDKLFNHVFKKQALKEKSFQEMQGSWTKYDYLEVTFSELLSLNERKTSDLIANQHSELFDIQPPLSMSVSDDHNQCEGSEVKQFNDFAVSPKNHNSL